MFADVRLLHDLHAAHHLQSLSMAEPRGLGFEDEPINASDYIISGISGEPAALVAARQTARLPVAWRVCASECAREAGLEREGGGAGRCSSNGWGRRRKAGQAAQRQACLVAGAKGRARAALCG